MNVSSLTPSPNSTRPYLIRALYEWCTDNGYTPYIAAFVDETVQVPMEYVKNNEIVLNVSMDATSSLKLGNEFVEFKARFGGKAREIMVPIERVIAIYARENGQGMSFPVAQAVPPRGEVESASPVLQRPHAVPHAVPLSAPHAGADISEFKASAGDHHHNLTQSDNAPVHKLIQLVSTSPDHAAKPSHADGDHENGGNGGDSGDDAAPKPPSGPRPALKRVK